MQAVVLVVDTTVVSCIEAARDEFLSIASDAALVGVPLLVLANKQDVDTAASAIVVAERLELILMTDRPWHVQECSTGLGEGLHEGMDWLVDTLQDGFPEPHAAGKTHAICSHANSP